MCKHYFDNRDDIKFLGGDEKDILESLPSQNVIDGEVHSEFIDNQTWNNDIALAFSP